MKHRSKRLLGILFSFVLMLGLSAGMSITALADDTENFSAPTSYPLWVGGVQVTEENAANITGGETVTASYDADTKTLSLNGYTYSGEGHSYPYRIDDFTQYLNSAVQYDGDSTLTIALQGTNSITCTGNSQEGTTVYYGIHSKSGVKIDGTGSIAVNAKDQGLFVSTGDLEILGGSITASLEDGYPVEVHGNVVIGENARAVTFETSGKNNTSVSIFPEKNLVINGGTVQIASYGEGGKAVSASTVIIGENVTGFTAIGAKGAFMAETRDVKVKNAIAGTGWTDVDGTEGKTAIAVSAEGQVLSSYKYVQFLGLESAKVTTAPTAKTLTYSGLEQELVTAGEATGGAMQYALGTETEATEPYTTSIPTANNAGTYHVWYKAVGDESHKDSKPENVRTTIDKASIAKAKVTLEQTSYTYNGKAKKPKVKSVVLNDKNLKSGTDYKVTYKNSKGLGTATAIVSGKGNYKDSAKSTYKIVLAKVKVLTVESTSKSSFDVSWKKVKGAKKYQLQYKQAGSEWKTATAKGTSKTVKGLKAGKTYQIRVRAVAGKQKGAWSKKTSVDVMSGTRATDKSAKALTTQESSLTAAKM